MLRNFSMYAWLFTDTVCVKYIPISSLLQKKMLSNTVMFIKDLGLVERTHIIMQITEDFCVYGVANISSYTLVKWVCF